MPVEELQEVLLNLQQCDYDPHREGSSFNELHAPRANGLHDQTDGLTGFTVDGQLSAICHEPSADEIDERLGWREPGEATEARPNDFADAGEALEKLFQWICNTPDISAIGNRAIALICATRPDLIQAKRPTLAELARSVGITRACLQKHSRGIRTLTEDGFTGHGQQSQAVREASRQRALKQHADKRSNASRRIQGTNL